MPIVTATVRPPTESAIAEVEVVSKRPGHARTSSRVVFSEDLQWVPPGQMLLGALRRPTLRVMTPFNLTIKKEGDHTLAEATEIEELGFGRNFSEAITDLQAAIAELYETLEREQTRLGPDLRRVWEILQQKVARRV